MVTVRIPSIGELLLNIGTLIFIDGFNYISGHDDEGIFYMLKCSYISWQDDLSHEYGWARIVEYRTSADVVKCDIFTSIA